MNSYLELLGHKVRDRVTGFEGVVSSVSFDLFGCVQTVVTPPMDKKTGKRPDSEWFDHKRLEKLSKEPVMKQPSFVEQPLKVGDERGPADKPYRRL